jgi:hypothetical protein
MGSHGDDHRNRRGSRVVDYPASQQAQPGRAQKRRISARRCGRPVERRKCYVGHRSRGSESEFGERAIPDVHFVKLLE